MADTIPIIFCVGPTGVGKSDAAMAVAGSLNAQIIACDAMQVYREVNIANGKPSLEDQKRIPHHVLDCVSVTEEFDVSRYRQLALEAIDHIIARKKIPLIVGGSGMYMTVLLDGIFDDVVKDNELRESLEYQARQEGMGALYQRLASLDLEAANNIHPNNLKRVIRALEVVLLTGQPISALQKKRDGLWGKRPIKIVGLTRPREILYARVEARIEAMFNNGLVEEVETIRALTLSQTSRTIIGVPEVGGYLDGLYGLEQAKYLMKRNTRHYVKRQLTWFNRDKRIQWVNIDEGTTTQQIGAEIFGLLN